MEMKFICIDKIGFVLLLETCGSSGITRLQSLVEKLITFIFNYPREHMQVNMQILYSFEQAREVNVIFFILQFLEYSDNNKIYRQGDIILQKKFIERAIDNYS